MKVALIHFSDFHISSQEDFIVTNVSKIAAACRPLTNLCEKICIIVTGDIIDRGNVAAYTYAETALRGLKSELLSENFKADIQYVIVPGNHDNKYKCPQAIVRSALIKGIKDSDRVDEELFPICLDPQTDYWKFYSKITEEEQKPSVSSVKDVQLDDTHRLKIVSYNTSVFLEANENDGFCLVPENTFINIEDETPNVQQIVITLFHHNPCWLDSQTERNNRVKFRSHISSSSHILLCGHEHNKASELRTELESEDQVLYLEAESLQVGDHHSFQIYMLDTEKWEQIEIQDVNEEDGELILSTPKTKLLPQKTHSFEFVETWKQDLLNTGAPLSHPFKKDLNLRDIYVFPDLQPLTDLSGDKVYMYTDAADLLEDLISGRVYILQGESQSGRTSLLKMYAMHMYEKGVYPLFLRGEEIQGVRIGGTLQQAYKKQYARNAMSSYEKYTMLEKKKRILLIDNIDKSTLNVSAKNELYKTLLNTFEWIIVTSKDVIDIGTLIDQNNTESNFIQYHIEPFGYEKRNNLIDKWYRIGQNMSTFQSEAVADQIKIIFNQVTAILGKELMPAYPIFILPLIQTQQLIQENNAPLQHTSYATLYEILLKGALNKSNFVQGDFDGIIRFLSYVAYHMHQHKIRVFAEFASTSTPVGFYNEYDKYVTNYNLREGRETILAKLKPSFVREEENAVYSFSYKYIYYYLVARYIAENLDTDEGKREVTELRDTLHKEESANILVFLAYLDKHKVLLDELQLATWLPFEDIPEATLRQDDVLFKKLQQLISSIKDNILQLNVDSKQERSRQLNEADRQSRQIKAAQQSGNAMVPTEENFEHDPILRDINNTYRITSIIGQVVKNQRDTVEHDTLISLIEDTYRANFRFINYIADMLSREKKEIIDGFIANNPRAQSMKYSELERRVGVLLQQLLLKLTYGIFTHLSVSVGTGGIDKYYDEVASKIDSPAADIISFTIKSYYAPMKISELEYLMNKYKNNIVVTNFLRARVRAYVYNHELTREKKQQFGQIAGMRMIDSHAAALAKRNKR